MTWYPSYMLGVWLLASANTNVNNLRPRQNDRYFPDDIFRCIFYHENIPISILKFVPNGPINIIAVLVRHPGDKPLSITNDG